jgi:hypothetical protein
MRRIPAVMALLALSGGVAAALVASPAGAEEAEAATATAATDTSDLIDLDAVLTIDLVSLGLDATLTVAGTGIADISVTVGP